MKLILLGLLLSLNLALTFKKSNFFSLNSKKNNTNKIIKTNHKVKYSNSPYDIDEAYKLNVVDNLNKEYDMMHNYYIYTESFESQLIDFTLKGIQNIQFLFMNFALVIFMIRAKDFMAFSNSCFQKNFKAPSAD